MKIGVLGTGMVGQSIGSKLVSVGHDVHMGARDKTNRKASAWAGRHGMHANSGSFADAAKFGEVIFNCTSGLHSLEALEAAGKSNLHKKIIIDVANPLQYIPGHAPILSVSNTDSLGEQIQRAFPDSRVVKTLNTMSANVMVDPSRVQGAHTVFVSGNNSAAKKVVFDILKQFGWSEQSVIDLGGIETARGVEMSLPLWLSTWRVFGTTDFNLSMSC